MPIGLFEEIYRYTPKRRKSYSHKIDDQKGFSFLDRSAGVQFWRIVIALLLVFFVYLLLIGKAVSIQISNKEKYLSLAENNRIREFSIFPSRGLIYDNNGSIIVRNKPRFSVELNTLICSDPESLYTCAQTIENVGKYISLDDAEKVVAELEARRIHILLATGVDKDKVLILESNNKEIPGVSIETAPARDYLLGEAMAHVVGYVGQGETLTPTIIGKSGIEEMYDRYLSGVSGNRVVQVDSAGTRYKVITYKNPLPGKNVDLFIDHDLQKKAYEILKAKVDDPESEANAGAIVAQNQMDGSVLALVSYPSFDPNKLSSGISREELARINSDPGFPFFNRAISAAYPPGSTFKLVTASAILMQKVASVTDTIFDNGYIQVGSFIFRNWNLGGHGEVNLLRALQVSNDTYFYIMGGGYGGVGGLGIEKLSEWAKKLGYGSKTGIDISGEVSGYMPDGTAREWYLGDDYISAIGQGDILATPLQVNNMTTYFANGGVLFKPRIVKRIDGVGETEPEVLAQNLIDADYYDVVRKGVNMASSPGGTAYPLYDIPEKYGVEVAGKTGTSEYIDPNGEPGTHAWFTVFAPYYEDIDEQAMANPIDDAPITITVFIEGGGGGSDDAAPLARELIGFWLEKQKK